MQAKLGVEIHDIYNGAMPAECRSVDGISYALGKTRGIVEEVNHRAVLVRIPKEHVPIQLLSQPQGADEARLDATLAEYGYPAGPSYGGQAPGYGGNCTPNGRWGYPGYYGWYGGWFLWWLAFAWIFLLAFLF